MSRSEIRGMTGSERRVRALATQKASYIRLVRKMTTVTSQLRYFAQHKLGLGIRTVRCICGGA